MTWPTKYSSLIILFAVSALTHLVFLAYPRQVIFDEVHFGKFVSAYCCTGERFFDIHPPHTKLLIAGAAALGGYAGDFTFENIGQPYQEVPVTALRLIPAFAGTLLPLVIYILLRQLGVSQPVATLGALTVVFDNALTVQARLISLDSILLLSTFGALATFLAAEKASGWREAAWLAGAGALAGLAAGTKFTGLAALALLGVLVLVNILRALRVPVTRYALRVTRYISPALPWLARGLLILISAATIYLGGWLLHFLLLPLPGPGDAFREPTSLLSGQATLPDFLDETVKLHRVMFDANFNLQAGHPDASSWWSWPLMQTAVFYWQGTVGENPAFIYFIGNPIVWWGTTALFAITVIAAVISYGRRHEGPRHLWIPIVGYAIAMAPLVRVPRALFLYHYLTPLLFALLASCLWFDRWLSRRTTTSQRRSILIWSGALLLVGFLYFSPLTYGLPLPNSLHPLFFWFPTWR